MSQRHPQRTDSQPASRPASPDGSPYATDTDWWYDSHDSTGNAEDASRNGGHDELPGTTRAEYVAHSILKQDATLLDPIALSEPPDRGLAPLFEFLFGEPTGEAHDPAALHSENEQVTVSDPAVYVPREHTDDTRRIDYNQFSKRWRISDEFGYLCRGPVIADRPTEEFLAVVREVLDMATQAGYREFAPGERDEIRERATQMKADPAGPHDETIMAEVVRCIDDPSRVETDARGGA